MDLSTGMAFGVHRFVVWSAGRSSDWGRLHTPGSRLTSEPPSLIPAKGLVVISLPALLGRVLGLANPGEWDFMTEVKVHTSAQSLIKLVY